MVVHAIALYFHCENHSMDHSTDCMSSLSEDITHFCFTLVNNANVTIWHLVCIIPWSNVTMCKMIVYIAQSQLWLCTQCTIRRYADCLRLYCMLPVYEQRVYAI